MAAAYPGAPDDVGQIISVYKSQVGEVEALVAGLSPDHVKARPIPGRWSMLELLCHIADSEQVMADRMKRTIAQPAALLMAYDESHYVAKLAYDRRDAAEELALIRATRLQMARILRLLPPEAWDRQAVHSERGINTLKDLAQTAIGHTLHHVPFIKEKRTALGLRTP